jgi:uncharacterized membrane protein YqjE
MARQATLNPNPGASLNGMLHEIGDLGSNVVTLTTLQARLAAEDFRESASRAQPALIAAAVLIPLGFASFTVGLLGIAWWATTGLGIRPAYSLLMVAAAGLVLTVFAGVFVIQHIRASLASFRRSREELERNIAWLRTVAMHSGR